MENSTTIETLSMYGIQSNAEETKELKANSSERVYKEEYEQFTIVKFSNSKYIIACGGFKCEKEFNSMEEAIAFIDTKPWELIGMLIGVAFTYEKDKEAKKH